MFKEKNILTIPLAIFLVAVFYLFFPTNNSTLDAYGYAAQVKFQNHIFAYHHLLNGGVYYVIIKLFQLVNPNLDVLKTCIFLNSIFVVINLIILSKILKNLKFQKQEIAVLIFLVGFSYNFWRFGTENEVYILPITFSLLGSYFLLKYLLKPQSFTIFLSGLFAAFACLFHQIHFFWWLGILVGIIYYFKNFKTFLLYSVSAVWVPIVYALVIVFYEGEKLNFYNFFSYIFHDYISGSAKNEIGINNFMMMAISFVRAFLQVHPNILFLIKNNYLLAFPILILIWFLIIFTKSFFKKNLYKSRENVLKTFIKIHFILLGLQLFFAFLAVGNVEFMVMVPVLLCLTILYRWKVNLKVLEVFTILLFFWNFTFGVFVNHHYKLQNEEHFVEFAMAHPNDFFIVEDNLFLNQYFYKTGIEEAQNIKKNDQIKSQEDLKNFHKKGKLYTNIIGKPVILNRKKYIYGEEKESQLSNKKLVLVENYQSFYGINSIYQVIGK